MSLLGLFSHNVIAHQGSILASGHIEVLAFALMALGILLATIAAALSVPRDAIEEGIEPFLIQEGLIQRTPRGRILGDLAWIHLGIEKPI